MAAPSPAHLDLADVVGGDKDPDADRDEDEANDEKGGQHRAGRKDGLPGWQPLLLEGRVIRPPVLSGAPRGTRGPAVHLVLRVIDQGAWLGRWASLLGVSSAGAAWRSAV